MGAGCEQVSSFRKKIYLKLLGTVMAGRRAHPTHPTSQFAANVLISIHPNIKAQELERLGKTCLSLPLSYLCFNCCCRHFHTSKQSYLPRFDLALGREASFPLRPPKTNKFPRRPASRAPLRGDWSAIYFLEQRGREILQNHIGLFEPASQRNLFRILPIFCGTDA